MKVEHEKVSRETKCQSCALAKHGVSASIKLKSKPRIKLTITTPTSLYTTTMTIQPSTYPLDLKHHVPDNETGAPTSRPTSRRRPFALAFAAVALCYFVFTAVTRPELFRHCGGLSRELSISPAEVWVQTEDERPLVPLEAHIMSKCPDAQVGCTSWV